MNRMATTTPTQFFLGTHRPHWLALTERPLFVSHRILRDYKRLPRARGIWALDSGGFTELAMHGRWTVTPREYAAAVRRYRDQIGGLQFASQQDWMCEPHMVRKTGLSVHEHQVRTVSNYLDLMAIAPDLPWMPVVQGWSTGEYLDHCEMWGRAGVNLPALPHVGIGSVCRRHQVIRAAYTIGLLADLGLKLHGFGVKAGILALAADDLASADSMAWSYAARREARAKDAPLSAKGRANKIEAAVDWFDARVAPVLEAQAARLAAPLRAA